MGQKIHCVARHEPLRLAQSERSDAELPPTFVPEQLPQAASPRGRRADAAAGDVGARCGRPTLAPCSEGLVANQDQQRARHSRDKADWPNGIRFAAIDQIGIGRRPGGCCRDSQHDRAGRRGRTAERQDQTGNHARDSPKTDPHEPTLSECWVSGVSCQAAIQPRRV